MVEYFTHSSIGAVTPSMVGAPSLRDPSRASPLKGGIKLCMCKKDVREGSRRGGAPTIEGVTAPIEGCVKHPTIDGVTAPIEGEGSSQGVD